MEKIKNIPTLRFPEFKNLWNCKVLSEIIIKLESGVSVNSTDEPVKRNTQFGILKTSCISSGKFYHHQNKTIIAEDLNRAKLNPVKDSILISRMNTPLLVGESGYIDKDYPNLFIPDRLWMTIVDKTHTNSKLLSIILSSENMMGKISNIATGTSGSMKNISKPNFLNLEVRIPTLPEQTKIASFLTVIDDKLQVLKQKKNLLEQYKKGVMQKIFSQELRFKDDNGNDYPDWEETKLGEILIEKNEKTSSSGQHRILSSTAKGIFNQDEYFTRDIASKDNTGYKILRKYQLVFSPQNLWLGNINVNMNFEIGIVSPSYKIFSFDEKFTIAEYCQYFLLTPKMMFEYEQSSTQGASVVRRNLDMDKFLSIEFLLPSIGEQTKIANFLSAIDDKINHCEAQIDKTEVWKKGLLQQMFV
jgi:type I restriction enzyme S subunit